MRGSLKSCIFTNSFEDLGFYAVANIWKTLNPLLLECHNTHFPETMLVFLGTCIACVQSPNHCFFVLHSQVITHHHTELTSFPNFVSFSTSVQIGADWIILISSHLSSYMGRRDNQDLERTHSVCVFILHLGKISSHAFCTVYFKCIKDKMKALSSGAVLSLWH